jgi:(1->4)-alpha-D-glucan 1-alpha-D-glucosylmutase
MAKGVEDTALYRWTRLVSINDVGADPDVTGVTIEHFHEANQRRRAGWPHAMLATSTHDNKRGEYVRMRINLISEDPDGWSGIAGDWRRAAETLMSRAGMGRKPSAGDLYLLFQTFVGTWPVPTSDLQDYAARLKAYMTKACREAKLHTSWTEPDEAYEGAVHQLVDLILGDQELAARIERDVRPFAWYGALNSLSLTALKLTVPGVPDIYQGANVLDDSLVDPDNRRPVDFAAREETIRELVELAGRPADEIRRALSDWLAGGDFGRLKLWTIHRRLPAGAGAGHARTALRRLRPQQPAPRGAGAGDPALSRTWLPRLGCRRPGGHLLLGRHLPRPAGGGHSRREPAGHPARCDGRQRPRRRQHAGPGRVADAAGAARHAADRRDQLRHRAGLSGMDARKHPSEHRPEHPPSFIPASTPAGSS